MSRKKIFLMAFVFMLLSAILCHVAVVWGQEDKSSIILKEPEDGSNPTMTFELLNGTHLHEKLDNVFCVAADQYSGHYNAEVKAVAEITGNTVYLKEYSYKDNDENDNKPGTYTVIKDERVILEGVAGEYSNKFAAIFNIPELYENKDTLYSYSTGVAWDVSGRQVGATRYWNDWVNSLPEYWKGIFEINGKNAKRYKNGIEEVNRIVNENTSNNEVYSIKIYYCEPVEDKAEGDWQNVIVTEPLPDPLTSVSVEKVWTDKDAKMYPSSIVVRLYENGERTEKTLTLGESTIESQNWRGSFTGLAKYDNKGEEIQYTVKEEDTNGNDVAGYISEVSENSTNEFTITNKPEKIKLKVQKVWDDGDNRDGKRTESIKVQLLKNSEVEIDDIVLDESNNWTHTTEEMYKYKNGKEIDYEFREIDVPDGYSVSIVEGEEIDKIVSYTVTNKHEPELVEIPVEKDWEDDSDRDGRRPESIKINLYADGELKATKTLTGLNTENTWKYTFTSTDTVKLYKYKNEGQLINYTIEEVEVKLEDLKDYEVPKYELIDGVYRIINDHETAKVKVKVIKEWNDQSDLDEYRPESITLKLLANGQPAKDADGNDVSKVVLKNPDGALTDTWEQEVTNLHRYYDHGKEIEYTIVEENVPDKYKAGEMQIETSTTADGMKLVTLKMENKYEPSYEGYIEITGKVWEDKTDGKANAVNGILDDDESGLEGIKVVLKDVNGNQFDATSTATTDKNGNYTIKVNYDNSNKAYKLYEDINTVQTKLNTAYVEFEYDGLKYTTVKTEATGNNTSKAIENENKRNQFDNAHNTVVLSTQHPDKWTDKTITAITKDVISFENYEDINNRTSTEVIKYCNGDGTYIRTNPEGAWKSVIKETLENDRDHTEKCSGKGHTMRTFDVQVEIIQNVNLGLFKKEQPFVGIEIDLSKVKVIMNSQEYTYLYNKRTTVAEEKAKEAYDQAYNYALEMGMTEEEAKKYAEQIKLQVKFQNEDVYTYRRPVNPADIAYINKTNKDVMDVYVTYEVKVYSLSSTLITTIHQISNYFDSRYTLTSAGWDTTNTGSIYNKATTQGDLNIKLLPGTESSVLELTYEISAEAIKDLLNEQATLNNAVEIVAYSTEYGANTLYAEQRKGGRTNQPYAGYDYKSHPGNVQEPIDRLKINSEGRLEIENIEADEKIAPSFVLCLDPEDPPTPPGTPPPDDPKYEERILSGNVWEDTDADDSDEFRVGDGKKTGDEQNLASVKVELYHVNDDGTIGDIAKLYYSDGREPIDAVTYSDANGNYSFGNDEEGYGVVTDRYIIKFTYGEGIDGSIKSTINGQNVDARNYKSTIISTGTDIYNVFKGTSDSEEWHLNIGKGYSIAVDNIQKRVDIEDLQYSNFENGTIMEAYSKPFKMQVEFDPSENKVSQVGEDGETVFGNELSVFDFGIIERAREDIFVEDTIEYLNITLANTQSLTNGNPTNSTLNYVKSNGFKQIIDSGYAARNALQKRMIVEMDAELIQGAQLDITYAIKVTNNSEKEYDYYVDDQIKSEFYYYGTNNENSPLIKDSVNYLVTYVDVDLGYEWNNEERWQEKTATELLADGLISQATHDEIVNKYKAYVTTQYSELAPGETSEVEYLNAKRVLANTGENVFENHVEILQLDAKSGRTIKGIEDDGTPELKEYKMGNYVPGTDGRRTYKDVNNKSVFVPVGFEKAGLHEQDDDGNEIIIGDPTGVTNYIIPYIIAGLAGLIVISLGIVIIKKKVLTK